MEALQGLETEKGRLHGVYIAAIRGSPTLPPVVVNGRLQLGRRGQLGLLALVRVQVLGVSSGTGDAIVSKSQQGILLAEIKAIMHVGLCCPAQCAKQ